MKAEVEVEAEIQDFALFAYLPSVLILMTPTKIKRKFEISRLVTISKEQDCHLNHYLFFDGGQLLLKFVESLVVYRGWC